MFCAQCGSNVPDGSQFCPYCGGAAAASQTQQPAAQQYYQQPVYAQPTTYQQPAYAQAGVYQQPAYAQVTAYQPAVAAPGVKKRTTAGLLAIFLGAFGVHKFYLGKTKPAVITLLAGTLGFLIIVGPIATGIIGVIEGIKYLTMSDSEFYYTYVVGQKEWF